MERRVFLRSGLGLLAGAGAVAAGQGMAAKAAEPTASVAATTAPPAANARYEAHAFRITLDAKGYFRVEAV